ncbi:hypothetical protein [Rhizobium sp. L1K21]|uniref:hypothetical protein n=1 Tax=Rhizobium sp. L1K21 TaxID=2954933 RepID=UPI00209279A0|nr:hypothetical protein [Rhizobium sp. L1K21]MCO6186980.1 hypothetical protein [Rhizobium sp. L1K21]
MQSKSNALYFIVGALVVVIAGMGYYIYDQQKDDGTVSLKIGEGGVSVEKN